MKNKYPRVAGSAALTNLLHLHLRLDVISKSSKCASGIIEAGSFDLHLAAIAAIGGALKIGKAIFFQDWRVRGIGRSRIFGGLHALGINAPAAKGLRQRARREPLTGR